MPDVFFTGFPGFLGSALLPRVLDRRPDDRAVCLVQPKFAEMAAAKADRLIADHPSLNGRIELIEGDITEADLGFSDHSALLKNVREIYHLAAVYDLCPLTSLQSSSPFSSSMNRVTRSETVPPGMDSH